MRPPAGPSARPFDTAAEVWDASFSPDGRLIVTAGLDGTARLWEIGRGESRPDRPRGPYARTGESTASRTGGVYTRLCHATIDRTGSRVLISGDRLARLVDVDTGEPIGRPMTQQDWSQDTIAAFSPDGRRIAIGESRRRPLRGGEGRRLRGRSAGPRMRRRAGRSRSCYHTSAGSPPWPSAPTARCWPPSRCKRHGPALGYRDRDTDRPAVRRGRGCTQHGLQPRWPVAGGRARPGKPQAIALGPGHRPGPGRCGALQQQVECLAFSPDGSALAAGSSGWIVRSHRHGHGTGPGQAPPGGTC